ATKREMSIERNDRLFHLSLLSTYHSHLLRVHMPLISEWVCSIRCAVSVATRTADSQTDEHFRQPTQTRPARKEVSTSRGTSLSLCVCIRRMYLTLCLSVCLSV